MAQEPSEYATTAYLVIQQGPQAGKRLEIWKDRTIIGRSLECDIFLEDLAVHRKQASILRTPAGFVLYDEHGSGDSFVNEQPVREQLLKDGDQLLFGNTRLTFFGHEGTRPFQLASSRGRELHVLRNSDPNTSVIAKLDIASFRGAMRSFELFPDMTIGRSRECDIFLEDLAVSRLHAKILSLGNGNYALKDEGSANGTKVNGQLVNKYQTYPLQEGDKIQLGQTVLVFAKR